MNSWLMIVWIHVTLYAKKYYVCCLYSSSSSYPSYILHYFRRWNICCITEHDRASPCRLAFRDWRYCLLLILVPVIICIMPSHSLWSVNLLWCCESYFIVVWLCLHSMITIGLRVVKIAFSNLKSFPREIIRYTAWLALDMKIKTY